MDNRYAIVENGVVVNVVLADADFAAQHGWMAVPKEVGPGWVYTDAQFSAPPPPPAPPEPVPAPAPTKAELLAQLQALQAQILSLE